MNAKISHEMTTYDLAQLMMAGFDRVDARFDRLEARVSFLEKNCVTKDDLKTTLASLEERLNRRIDKSYLHINKRMDQLAEKVA